MKRLFFISLFGLICWASFIFAQHVVYDNGNDQGFKFYYVSSDSVDKENLKEDIENSFRNHHKRHKEMMEKFFEGMSTKESFFRDIDHLFDSFDMFDDSSFFDRFNNFDQEKGRTNFFNNPDRSHNIFWENNSKGRTLIIKKKNGGKNLDIRVENNKISIKSKTEVNEEGFSSYSSSTQSVSSPSDCDASKVEIKETDDQIEIFFPFINPKDHVQLEHKDLNKKDHYPKSILNSPKSILKSDKKRFPLPPSHDDVEI